MLKQTGLASIGSAAKRSALTPCGSRNVRIASSASSDAFSTCGFHAGSESLPAGVPLLSGGMARAVRATEATAAHVRAAQRGKKWRLRIAKMVVGGEGGSSGVDEAPDYSLAN